MKGSWVLELCHHHISSWNLKCLPLKSSPIVFKPLLFPGPSPSQKMLFLMPWQSQSWLGPLCALTIMLGSAFFLTHRSRVWSCLSVCTWAEIQSHNNFKAVSLCPVDSCSPLPSHFHQRTKRWLVNNSLSSIVYSNKHNSHSTECYNVNILLNLF